MQVPDAGMAIPVLYVPATQLRQAALDELEVPVLYVPAWQAVHDVPGTGMSG
jgi:hypothetical protein